ncbi:MAG: LPS assembly protein LptD [bacterium]|nr:LPS assembly protein LptD [bacterium]
MKAVICPSRRLLTGCLVLVLAPASLAQPLVPLTDHVEDPLLPTGIIQEDVEMFGVLVYLWSDTEGADVIHVVGDFELHLGARRLEAREAVIWMTPRERDGVSYHVFEVFLWRGARVIEPAGTVTSGPILFVTLSSSGGVRVSADRKALESSSGRPVFAEATRVRAQISPTRRPGATEAPFEVAEPGSASADAPPTVRPKIDIISRDKVVAQVNGRRVITAIGDVLVVRYGPGGEDFLELRADAAVVYMAEDQPSVQTDPSPADLTERSSTENVAIRGVLGGLAGEQGGAELGRSDDVDAVYLEGDIVLTQGERTIRASQLYYDFRNDRAVILDAVFRTYLPERNVPVYIRAERVRQLSSRQFNAERPRISTSEFYTPHYYIGASRLELEDKTATELAGLRKGSFTMTHSTFNIGGLPLLYWPYTRGVLKEGETSIRGMRTGYSDDFGLELETEWQLFNLLGFETPVGFDAALRLDYFSERGPAAGVDLDYQRDDYFGWLRSYAINDSGEDNLGGRFRSEKPDSSSRGRFTLRHRHYLPDDWQLTVESSYISDKNFMEEYFESEFDTSKEQETLFYLKKQRDTWAFTLHGQWRVLDFLTQTERLPDLSFRVIGESLGGAATWYSENRAGWVRYRYAEQDFHDLIRHGARDDSSGTVGRLDSRQEIGVPFSVGPVNLVPFGTVRGSVWDDSPGGGGVGRILGGGGVRANAYLWRAYDVDSELWDIHGLRHIIKPEVTAWVSGSTCDSDELFPFDAHIEDLEEIDGVSVGVRQRWQTRRGAPGHERITDVFTFNLEAGFFNNAPGDDFTNGYLSYSRPENSISRNYLNASFIWRVNDTTALMSETNHDLNDGEIDVFNISYVVERPPRLSYLLGYRFIEESDSNLLALGANYRINEKHSLAVRERFDLRRGETEEFSLAIIRKLPRWYVAVKFDLDEIEDDLGVSMSVWPEGFPRAVLGPRRYTGVATSTGIRPE